MMKLLPQLPAVIVMIVVGTLMMFLITVMLILGALISFLAIAMSWVYPCSQSPADRRPTP